ncbi:MAG: galactokinase [Clostridiales bacterium]|jgi:galactokinase|nr:galactokinase [Clostridiales bacterium]
MAKSLQERFVDIYGAGGVIRVFAAPGRVNLIGEHIDYNGGCVLPAALTLDTKIAIRLTGGDTVRLAATTLADRVCLDIDRLNDYRGLKWGNYQAGVLQMLTEDGITIRGAELLYDTDIPFGAGLSSSASIEVATAYAFITLHNESEGVASSIDRTKLALLCQRAENAYAGVNCGIMDQFASANGKADNAILLNCSTLEFRHIPIRLGDYRLVVANTNKPHSLIASKYNERRSECEEALADLRAVLPALGSLSELTEEDFGNYSGAIQREVVRKRAEHVVTECARVTAACAALEGGHILTFGKLLNASHASLKELYEVTGAELDALAESAQKTPGCIGSRMTGAGFGGSTVSVVLKSEIESFIKTVGAAYTRATGYTAAFFMSEIGTGVRELRG